jgi:DNA-binding NtrC family response regulator
MARLLLIDDDRNLREVVTFMLEEAGHQVTAAGSAEEGLAQFAREAPDLVLTDVRMPGQDGLAVLAAVRPHGVPVVILTAHGTVRQAVEAMQRGASAYLLKPFEREELVVTVAKALDDERLRADNRNLRELLQRRQDDAGLVLRSAAMQRILDDARRFAASDAPVLITGESGTGKELVAHAVHRFSGRHDGPFVAVNCGAIAGELAESELFGHVRGAFTGADRDHTGRIRAAAGGSLFLDEIADLPAGLQPKLLRALDQRQVDPVGGTGPVDVDFRLVSATNRDLAGAVREGSFREDLYYRVAILHLHLPPLRERPEDIAPLWAHFTRLHGGEDVQTTPALLAALESRPWPGNIRELRNLNQRLVVLRTSARLDVADLARADAAGQGPTAAPPGGLALGALGDGHLSLPDLEREMVRQALARCGGNKSKAAKSLGIPRHVLIYRLKKFGL